MSWLEFVSSLRWPLLVALALVFLRREIRALLDRLLSVGPGGAKFSEPQPKAERIENAAGDLGQGVHPVVAQLIEDARKAAPTGPEKEQFAIRRVAAIAVWVNAMRLYAYTFGSQVRLLADCKNRGKVPLVDAEAYYRQGASENPAFYANYSFKQWIEWVMNAGLVRLEGDHVLLAPMGDALLIHKNSLNLPFPAN